MGLFASLRGCHSGRHCDHRAVFSQDDQRILTVGDSDHTLRLWEANSGQPLTTVHGAPFDNVFPRYRSDGTRSLTRDSDHSIKIWDGQGTELLRMLPTSPQQINTAFWSVSSLYAGVRLFEVQAGRLLLPRK